MLQGIDLTSIVECARLGWSPQIGDPTAAGWLTVAAYAVCAFLALKVSRNLESGREKAFWVLITFAMLCLCVNKQMDLQSFLTAVGRCIAQLQGWYEERRAFQRSFVIGLLVSSVFVLGIMVWLMRGRLWRNGLALLGMAVVTAFVAVRAVGFHHFDVFINERFADVRYNVLFELSGLILIAINAVARLRAT